MPALILGETARAIVKPVVDYAEANVISWAEVQGRATGAIKGAICDKLERQCVIPIGYRCAFNLEMQRAVMIRHLSISVARNGKMPSVPAVREIAKLFGFKNEIPGPDVFAFIEGKGEPHPAINLMEACE